MTANVKELAVYGLFHLLDSLLPLNKDLLGLVIEYISDDRDDWLLEYDDGEMEPEPNFVIVHSEKRSGNWTVTEMTNILLNTTTLDEEVLHDFWLRIFESVEKLTEGQRKREFPNYYAFEKKWEEDSLDTFIQSFVDGNEVAKLCTSTRELIENFSRGQLRIRQKEGKLEF